MDNFFNETLKVVLEVKEMEEDFIFTHLGDYLYGKYQIIIPKKLLLCALDEFRHNHPDIYECMIQEAQERSIKDDIIR